MTGEKLRAPFPWFGGKSMASDLIWSRLGNVDNYVEPFAGSLAVLLGSPRVHRAETVNDLDGFVANFWRATSMDPDAVANHADWPVNEADLHARHVWLVAKREDLTAHLMGDPDYYDAKIAGWWVWGVSSWIGGGWCSGNGPWVSADGRLVRDTGMGVHRKLPHLSGTGMGVHRQRPHLSDTGVGVHRGSPIHAWFLALRERLRRVRVCCGDWHRVLGPSVTTGIGTTAVVLDPPYSGDVRDPDLYVCDGHDIASDVRRWAIEHGYDPFFRIALCGYEGEHNDLVAAGWSVASWMAQGGYGNRSGNDNRTLERVWFSPHCLADRQGVLF